jgi:D-alanine-D-alanine ligase
MDARPLRAPFLAQDDTRLISREVVVHADHGVIADQFYAERLYCLEDITDLLERAGFVAIRRHEDLAAGSDRNQDLGMMAHRMVLTVQAPHRPLRPSSRRAAPRDVTVVLGDPRLPDGVKRNGRFNPEDFETVNRLGRALAELDAYRFAYLDNHASLLRDLRNDPPALVFNLCDEGYNNDAFQEMHVPAALEMLGIPYTGAGPTCLGLCYNKSLVRAIAADLEVPVPAETYFDVADHAATIPSAFPALVKPNFGDASLGITKDAVVETPEQLVDYLQCRSPPRGPARARGRLSRTRSLPPADSRLRVEVGARLAVLDGDPLPRSRSGRRDASAAR